MKQKKRETEIDAGMKLMNNKREKKREIITKVVGIFIRYKEKNITETRIFTYFTRL